MRTTVTLYVAVILVAAFGIGLVVFPTLPHAAAQTPAQKLQASTSRASSAASTNAFDEIGMVALDQGMSGKTVPFLLYTRQVGGTSKVATKRLVFTSDATCRANDLPCATIEGNSTVLKADDHIRVHGTVRDDTVYVTEIEYL